MFDIKCFKDGTRLVIAIDGLENIDSDENIICNFIKTLIPNSNIEKIVDAEAAPVIEKDDPIIKYIGIAPYENVTAHQALFSEDTTANNAAFQFFNDGIKNQIFSCEKLAEIYIELNAYLKNRFCKVTDPEAYAKKLTLKQLVIFMNQYYALLPEIKMELSSSLNIDEKNYNAVTEDNQESYKQAVAFILKSLLQ